MPAPAGNFILWLRAYLPGQTILDTAWEVAAVGTRLDMRRRGYGKAVVSFVAAYILQAGRLATCSAAGDNLAMQRTAESVGFFACSGLWSRSLAFDDLLTPVD